ncbi:TonB-dependent receptor [Sphingobacterium paucimobilis]|uniref:TonB-dependent receptor plug domain-containing protein n=1 Tax=Sphingobacterium paucimobilis HER1398 TaxID=1346330 RepID=U2J1V9_9SPHI|nr:TonB-dependent receptor [Sphingobacterium paucimobilis]ERJ58949.1 hypothetical protein M472_09210 [Sphingobacterium paucimobilis HER1398]
MRKAYTLIILLCCICTYSKSQTQATLEGSVFYKESQLSNATITLLNTNYRTYSDAKGNFKIQEIRPGKYYLHVQADGFSDFLEEIQLAVGLQKQAILLSKTEQRLPEVVVTADKKEAGMQKTPLSLTVLNAKDIQAMRLRDAKDLTAIVPNLYAANPGDLRNVISIRGITTTSYDPAVTTYIDEVNQFSLDTYISQLHDIERIEVLRGPQSSLYGRNASGGVINIITKQPGNNTSGFAEISLGNYHAQRYALGFRTPLVHDKLYFGASAMYTKRNGYYTNKSTQSSYDDMQLHQGNYFLTYNVHSKLTFQLNVKHQGHSNEGPFPLVMGIDQAFEHPFELDQNRNTTMKDQTVNVSLSARYQGKNYLLNAQSSYQQNYRYYQNPIDGDFSSNDIIAIVNNYGRPWNTNSVYMQEVRLSSTLPSASKFRWNMGLYSFQQHSPTKQGTYYGNDAGMYGLPLTNFTDITINKLDTWGGAAFGQVDYQLSPDLYITAGLRYDYEHRKQQIEGTFLPDNGEVTVTTPDTSATAHYSNLSPKLSFNYQIAKDNLLYASYSRGFRAGGMSQLSGDPTQPPLASYNAEHSNNLEIGSKNMFMNQRLKLNATLFYSQIKNGQIPVLIMPQALTFIQNAAMMTSKGLELELAAIPLQGLEASYNFGYTHARYNDLTVITEGSNQDLSHNKQIFTPRTTSFLSLQYTRDIPALGNSKLFGRIEHKNIGKQYFDLTNTLSQDSYSLWNARIGLQYKRIELALWGANLSDEKYIAYAYDFGAINLGSPRTYGLTIKSIF